jgi:hypothetical protein
VQGVICPGAAARQVNQTERHEKHYGMVGEVERQFRSVHRKPHIVAEKIDHQRRQEAKAQNEEYDDQDWTRPQLKRG